MGMEWYMDWESKMGRPPTWRVMFKRRGCNRRRCMEVQNSSGWVSSAEWMIWYNVPFQKLPLAEWRLASNGITWLFIILGRGLARHAGAISWHNRGATEDLWRPWWFQRRRHRYHLADPVDTESRTQLKSFNCNGLRTEACVVCVLHLGLVQKC